MTFSEFVTSKKSSKEFIEDAINSNSISIDRINQSSDVPFEGDEDEILNKTHILGFPEDK